MGISYLLAPLHTVAHYSTSCPQFLLLLLSTSGLTTLTGGLAANPSLKKRKQIGIGFYSFP